MRSIAFRWSQFHNPVRLQFFSLVSYKSLFYLYDKLEQSDFFIENKYLPILKRDHCLHRHKYVKQITKLSLLARIKDS